MNRVVSPSYCSVAIVLVWFGPLPAYHEMWCQSIFYNPKFDWFLITDTRADHPNVQFTKNIPNIKHIYTTRDDMLELIRKKCHISIDPAFKSYKVCDYRPLFGRIFDHLLEKYDYWAWTDNDVIYGDLHSVISEKLGTLDVIGTGQCNRCSGPLCFFKNNDSIVNLYKRLNPDVFRGEHIGVDEGLFSDVVKSVVPKDKLDLSCKEHPWPRGHPEATYPILWFEGKFLNDDGTVMINKQTKGQYCLFHFGGGPRVKLRRNLEISVSNLSFPCRGIQISNSFEVMYHSAPYVDQFWTWKKTWPRIAEKKTVVDR